MTEFTPKRLMVCGGAGFIGSQFVRTVNERLPDCEIYVYDKLTYAGRRENLEGTRYWFRFGDICGEAFAGEVKERKIDSIVNFAASTHVDRSMGRATEFLHTNVGGVVNIISSIRRSSVERFVQVSSDECYGPLTDGTPAFDEHAQLAPRNVYAATKLMGDVYALAHYHTHGTPVMITRGCNTYGKMQYPEKLIPLVVTNFLEGLKAPVYGNGHQKRQWMHVEDHCTGVLTVLQKGTPGEVYNISPLVGPEVFPDKYMDNLGVVQYLAKCAGLDDSQIAHIADRPGHDQAYRIWARKLALLGWKPVYAELPHYLKQGLWETWMWYRDHPGWWKPIRESKEFRDYYEKHYSGKGL